MRVPLVRFRAQAMQEAVPVGQGGMAAILGLTTTTCAPRAAKRRRARSSRPSISTRRRQIVIAGHKAAVERACELAKAKGAKRAMKLAVSAPFHSSLLKPASDRLRDYMAGIHVRTRRRSP